MAGRDTVGIEVPNPTKEKVRLKELMRNRELFEKMKLPMFLGKDASGEPLIADLTKMPHVLIAGTTGSGKSVCMNTIVMSFLYTKKPNELKLVLVDPKMVEMSQFKDIPHLMCPVVTEMSKAAAILEWAVGKMDERYELLAEAGCRDIAVVQRTRRGGADRPVHAGGPGRARRSSTSRRRRGSRGSSPTWSSSSTSSPT
jgi:S-DNA-T family DNA segregation ATPase FtsK/SpoIIIE